MCFCHCRDGWHFTYFKEIPTGSTPHALNRHCWNKCLEGDKNQLGNTIHRGGLLTRATTVDEKWPGSQSHLSCYLQYTMLQKCSSSHFCTFCCRPSKTSTPASFPQAALALWCSGLVWDKQISALTLTSHRQETSNQQDIHSCDSLIHRH